MICKIMDFFITYFIIPLLSSIVGVSIILTVLVTCKFFMEKL